jgi:hypothetical protein
VHSVCAACTVTAKCLVHVADRDAGSFHQLLPIETECIEESSVLGYDAVLSLGG